MEQLYIILELLQDSYTLPSVQTAEWMGDRDMGQNIT